MHYTLAEIEAYLGAIERAEKAAKADALTIAALGAQGGAKQIDETLRRLR